MPKRPNITSKKRLSKKTSSSIVSRANPLKNIKVAIFLVIFIVLGTYLIIRSLAATGVILSVNNFDATKSLRAKIVTEKRPGTTNNITIVKLNPGSGAKATFISTTGLDAGQYRACAVGYAPDGEIKGTITFNQYNNGPVGTNVSHNYRLAHAADYAVFRCFLITITSNSPSTGSEIIITNTSTTSLRIAFIYIKSVGSVTAPTIVLTASPTNVTKGSASTLTWESTNTTSCLAEDAWTGSKAVSGSISTGALNSTSTFSLTCSGAGGSTKDSATVTVTDNPPPPPSLGFIGVNAYHTTDLAQITANGIKDIRVDNPAGTNVGSPSTAWYKAAMSNGLTILPQLNYNYWSDIGGGGDGHNGVPPQYASTWAKREVDLVYGAVKAAGAPTPEALEVYNEPWNCGFWRNPSDLTARASNYLDLIKATATYAWQQPGWSNVKILVSADTVDSACGGNSWRSPLLSADTTGFLSKPLIHPTVHPYAESRSPDETNVAGNHCAWDFTRYDCAYNDFKNHASNFGVTATPTVWATEYGWSTKVVSESTQASYTTLAIGKMQSSGIVEKSYAWLYASDSYYTNNGEDWLNSSNNCKLVCSAVQTYINTH